MIPKIKYAGRAYYKLSRCQTYKTKRVRSVCLARKTFSLDDVRRLAESIQENRYVNEIRQAVRNIMRNYENMSYSESNLASLSIDVDLIGQLWSIGTPVEVINTSVIYERNSYVATIDCYVEESLRFYSIMETLGV